MVKKQKKGKERLDKFYNLAKDQGYRARSAFKLIQLAKKQDFLSKAKICIDLCAAPGGWSQVAQRNMPHGALIIAVDLVPIKPIYGVVCMQSDITSDKCRNLLRKEMKGERADVVLHDGAPNVGASWAKDAFGQNELTLSAMKLACEHLKPGGVFVTKVFRSADYNSLMWVFGQLFSKVDATKPTASRNVSAEIFVICSGFKAGNIDPRFFDPKWVFMEVIEPAAHDVPGSSLAELLKIKQTKHRSGYDEGYDNKVMDADAFFVAENPAQVLVTHHRINLDAAGAKDIAGHPLTTSEIRELCADLKILGRRDLSALMKWRLRLLRDREKTERAKVKSKVAADAAAKAEAKGKKASPPSANGGVSEAEKATVSKDVDDAIAQFLQGAEKEPGEADDSASEAESVVNETEMRLEEDLAAEIESRRREERRQQKKISARQKKQEFRKKMTLSHKSQLPTETELFKGGKRNVLALKNEDKYVERPVKGSDEESEDTEQSESDSDEELDRYAKMELELAIDHERRQAHLEEHHRNKMQRQRKGKKETRRQRVMAAWAGELNAFEQSIDQQLATQRLQNTEAADALEDDDDDDESDGDLEALRDFQRAREMTADAKAPSGGNIDALALQASMDGPDVVRAPVQRKAPKKRRETTGESSTEAEEEEENPEMLALKDNNDHETLRSEHRAARWFSQDIFSTVGGDSALARGSDSESDSDDKIREVSDEKLPHLPLTDKEQRKRKRKKEQERLEKLGKKAKVDEEERKPLEVVPLEAPQPLVPSKGPQKPSDPQELAETLALGSVLVDSKKSRMDIIDASFNRWTFDRDEALPVWFTEEEDKFNKPELPITKELMKQYRDKLREINARPIRKVAEARARKKNRLQKRIEKLRGSAMSLANTPDMSEHAKAKQMKSMVRKLAKQDERKVSVVALKKGGGGKRMEKQQAPKGAKIKVVDRRMKSDKRGEKRAAKRNKAKTSAKSRRQVKKKSAKSLPKKK